MTTGSEQIIDDDIICQIAADLDTAAVYDDIFDQLAAQKNAHMNRDLVAAAGQRVDTFGFFMFGALLYGLGAFCKLGPVGRGRGRLVCAGGACLQRGQIFLIGATGCTVRNVIIDDLLLAPVQGPVLALHQNLGHIFARGHLDKTLEPGASLGNHM